MNETRVCVPPYTEAYEKVRQSFQKAAAITPLIPLSPEQALPILSDIQGAILSLSHTYTSKVAQLTLARLQYNEGNPNMIDQILRTGNLAMVEGYATQALLKPR